MKSILANFNELSGKNEVSNYINFLRSVRGKNINKTIISRWFNKLVPKDEYSQKDKKEILTYIVKLSKGAVECQKQG